MSMPACTALPPVEARYLKFFFHDADAETYLFLTQWGFMLEMSINKLRIISPCCSDKLALSKIGGWHCDSCSTPLELSPQLRFSWVPWTYVDEFLKLLLEPAFTKLGPLEAILAVSEAALALKEELYFYRKKWAS